MAEERKSIAVERRAGGGIDIDQDSRTLQGHAAVYDTEATIAGLFREIVRPGAFDRAVEGDDVIAYFQHGAEPWPVARTKSGTLRLRTDDKGLAYEMDLPDTQAGRDLEVLVRRGDIREMSFAFRPRGDGGSKWTKDSRNALPLRELVDVELYDVSPVVRAAYPGTSVSVRGAEDVLREELGPGDEQEPVAEAPKESGQVLGLLAEHLRLEGGEK